VSHTLHLIDAFTSRPFTGNPAAVCILEAPADEPWMKLVAREMKLSETAFLHPIAGGWSLRWLTPTVEVRRCGHATLASAFTKRANAAASSKWACAATAFCRAGRR